MKTAPGFAAPPEARRDPTTRELHGVSTTDDYAWMRHGGAELLDYLRAERRHYDAATAHYSPLRETLFDEMSQRVPSTDPSVSWRHGDWLYYTQTVPGKQYAQFCRSAAKTQVLLDLNEIAGESAYLALGVREMSPDGSLLAYSVDTDGDEVYELRIRDAATGSDLADVIPRSYYGCAWSADSTTLLYVVHDEAYRPHRVMRHRVGQPTADDTLVYEEPDERYEVMLEASRSGELIVISSDDRDTSEVWLLSASDVAGEPRLVTPRRAGIEYVVEHVPGDDGGDLYIVTNDGAPEFRLMRTALQRPGREHWVEVIGGNDAERLVAADAYRGHLVLTLRREGLTLLRFRDLATGALRDEAAEIPAGSIRASSRDVEHEPVRDPFDSTAATVMIDSLIEPPAWWEIDLATGDRVLRKTEPVPGYSSADYRTRQITATAADGVAVPITLAYRADIAQDGTAPCLLYGYGAYESCLDPWFEQPIASLLDRGVVYAVAHVRGGGECGRDWWQQGRLMRKRTTFTDFIAAADALAQGGWVDTNRIVTRGLSAGGLLQGAVFSMTPERWRAVVAEVPFVDCVNSMLDPTIPLTVNEWDEWGNPNDRADFEYMSSYSPYDNVPLGRRPNLLVTGSLHDARVLVHEPAKWVARLRATRSDDSLLLFRPELGSSAHVGPSGRYDRLRYEAEVLAFVLDELAATER
jgi:oligopeptidase B